MYNSRIWLNENNSEFTGSMVCFHGKVKTESENLESAFIEITDCYHKIRLHVGHGYDYSAYIAKIDKMIDELTKYKKTFRRIKK